MKFWLCLLTVPAWAQLSPGDLARAHEHLTGLGQCAQCHTVGSGAFREKCLSCHKVLSEKISAQKGLHANEGYENCRDCHSDHQGRSFDMIHWPEDMANFKHDLTGYSLKGAHSKADCNDCHKPELMADSQQLLKFGKDLSRTFFGLKPECLGCHQDEHNGQLGDDCKACHNNDAWKIPRFDHDRTHFPLVGAHARQDCADCHGTLQEKTVHYKPIEHQDCVDCHDNPHLNQLGDDCQDCHDQERFAPAPRFNHQKTRFQLRGAHQKTDCNACHPTTRRATGEPLVRYRPLRHDTCADCHKDPHTGRLGPDCSDCHQETTWAARADAPFDHQQTRYPLIGLHKEVTCDACHKSSLQIEHHNDCETCHRDVHLGQLAHFADEGNCKACHDERGFRPAHFTTVRHQKSRFPLAGAHLATPCFACHPEPTAQKPTPFRFESRDCETCHEDIHRGEADPFMGNKKCESCHITDNWHTLLFDHDRTHFPLAGKHAETSCGACHRKNDALKLTGLPQECDACHKDIHRGQFSDNPRGCEACHTPKHWFADGFDHNTRARFSLDGAHREVPCKSCHPTEDWLNRTLVRYKPLDRECAACHQD